jgi:hypothetical protein
MDVSEKRSAAEFGANVIARSDDRAATTEIRRNGVCLSRVDDRGVCQKSTLSLTNLQSITSAAQDCKKQAYIL